MAAAVLRGCGGLAVALVAVLCQVQLAAAGSRSAPQEVAAVIDDRGSATGEVAGSSQGEEAGSGQPDPDSEQPVPDAGRPSPRLRGPQPGSFRAWTEANQSMLHVACLVVLCVAVLLLKDLTPPEARAVLPEKVIELYTRRVAVRPPVDLVHIQRHGSAAAKVAVAECLGSSAGTAVPGTAAVRCGEDSGAIFLVEGGQAPERSLTRLQNVQAAADGEGGEAGRLPSDGDALDAVRSAEGDGGAAVAWFAAREDGTYDIKVASHGACRALIVANPEDGGSPTPVSLPTVKHAQTAVGGSAAQLLGVPVGSLVIVAASSWWKCMEHEDEKFAAKLWGYASTNPEEQVAAFFAHLAAASAHASGRFALARVGAEHAEVWRDAAPQEVDNLETLRNPPSLAHGSADHLGLIGQWLRPHGFDVGDVPRVGRWAKLPERRPGSAAS